jgi:hypothetical protein
MLPKETAMNTFVPKRNQQLLPVGTSKPVPSRVGDPEPVKVAAPGKQPSSHPGWGQAGTPRIKPNGFGS